MNQDEKNLKKLINEMIKDAKTLPPDMRPPKTWIKLWVTRVYINAVKQFNEDLKEVKNKINKL